MLTKIRTAMVCVVLAVAAPMASATVLNFDNLIGSGVVPTSYGGLTFTNWFYSDLVDPSYAPKSGLTNIFTDFGSPSITDGNATIVASTPFILDGAFFSGFSAVNFKLYLGNQIVFVSGALPTDTTGLGYGPTFLSSSYLGPIDKMVVSGVQGFFAMDDLTFHAVPEPGTMALMFAGMAVLSVRAHRKQQA